ncbi:MAG: type IX secretion system protein PorQ [Bacteroidota bacterium]
MKKNVLILLSILFLFLEKSEAQVGGDHIYEFLNLSNSARVTGLGGNLITVRDDDIALAYQNPAVLNKSMHQAISFNYNFHVSDISNGYAAYGHHVEKWDATIHGGIQYVTYGTFDLTDNIGNIQGQFKASEYAITGGIGKQLYENLSVGANLKIITSQFETYNSFGLATDLGAYYRDTSGRFGATLVFKNIGSQLSTYQDGNREPLPFDIQAGISRRLAHLPFRLSIIGHNLHRWNITYDDPNSVEQVFLIGDGEQNTDNAFRDWVDNFFRHVIFSGEFLFGKGEIIRLRIGYNHFMRRELSVANFRSRSGFSYGFGIKLRRFRVEFGRGVYHFAGGLNHLSISTNLKEFRR